MDYFYFFIWVIIGGVALWWFFPLYRRISYWFDRDKVLKEFDTYYTPEEKTSIAPRRRYNLRRESKDRDEEKIVGVSKPQGFWSRMIMNEKFAVISEMIKIARSDEHQGYWQDYITAQTRIESQRKGAGPKR